jgi:hypothetical protein
MPRTLIWLALAAAASALPAHWAAAQFKNEGMGVLVPPTRGFPHPAPGYNPLPSPSAPSAPVAADPVPPPAPAKPPPAASSSQPAK